MASATHVWSSKDEGHVGIISILKDFHSAKQVEGDWSRSELLSLQKMLSKKEYQDKTEFDMLRGNLSDALYVKVWENPEWKTCRTLNWTIQATLYTLRPALPTLQDLESAMHDDKKTSSAKSQPVKIEPQSDSDEDDDVPLQTPHKKKPQAHHIPKDDKSQINVDYKKRLRDSADVTTGRGLRRLFARAVSGNEDTRALLPTGQSVIFFREPLTDANKIEVDKWKLTSKDNLIQQPPVRQLRDDDGWTLDTRWNRSVFGSLLYYFHDWLARATSDTLGVISGKLPSGESDVTLQEVLNADLDNFATYISLQLIPVLKREGAFADVLIDREGTLYAVIRRIYHARFLHYAGTPKQDLYIIR
jgi:hypothetical protein